MVNDDVELQATKNDAYWLDKIWGKINAQEVPLNEKLDPVSAGAQLINWKDGIHCGAFSRDGVTSWRDEKTLHHMLRKGFDPDADMLEQLRFRSPALYTGVKNSLATMYQVKESVVTLVHETEPTPRLLYLKLTPHEDGAWWLAIDLAQFGACMSETNFAAIKQFRDLVWWDPVKQSAP